MMCTYKIFAQHMNEMVSIAMLTLLSIDRYIAILSSTNRTQWLASARKFRSSTGKMTTLCLGTWIGLGSNMFIDVFLSFVLFSIFFIFRASRFFFLDF